LHACLIHPLQLNTNVKNSDPLTQHLLLIALSLVENINFAKFLAYMISMCPIFLPLFINVPRESNFAADLWNGQCLGECLLMLAFHEEKRLYFYIFYCLPSAIFPPGGYSRQCSVLP
jgi:hypothetical protein